MNAEIYFFSGTGNSFVAARDIARILDGNLVPIAAAIKNEMVEPQSNVIGIVFPVFYATNDGGVPLIVERFIKKLKNLGSKYIFAVCTCGYMPGMTIENLSKTIESQN